MPAGVAAVTGALVGAGAVGELAAVVDEPPAGPVVPDGDAGLLPAAVGCGNGPPPDGEAARVRVQFTERVVEQCRADMQRMS